MAYDFKSEEEVKEFIKNLGIEYRFGCYHEKKPDVCHLLGDYLETIDKNYEKAWKLYQDACDNSKFARSCYQCGNYLIAGKGGQKQDQPKALAYYEKSCIYGEMAGCFRAGLLAAVLSSAKNPVRTFKQAISLFERGCEGDDHQSCYHLSAIYMEGNDKEKIAKDMKRCFELSLKACNLKNMYACANLSLMYRKGEGIEKNEELAEKYKLKAHDIQDEIIRQQKLNFQQGLPQT